MVNLSQVGSSDLRAYERVYNVDGDVTEVHVSGQPTWRYDYDSDANIVRASHHDKQRAIAVDAAAGGRLDSAGEQSYVTDADGRVVQRGRESFEYTTTGALSRAFDVGRHDVTFHYDAWGRLVVRRDALAGQSVTRRRDLFPDFLGQCSSSFSTPPGSAMNVVCLFAREHISETSKLLSKWNKTAITLMLVNSPVSYRQFTPPDTTQLDGRVESGGVK